MQRQKDQHVKTQKEEGGRAEKQGLPNNRSSTPYSPFTTCPIHKDVPFLIPGPETAFSVPLVSLPDQYWLQMCQDYQISPRITFFSH